MCSSSRRTFLATLCPESFDHVFVCFGPGALSRPDQALAILNSLLRPGGTMTVIEGEPRIGLLSPRQQRGSMAIQCLVELQRSAVETP